MLLLNTGLVCVIYTGWIIKLQWCKKQADVQESKLDRCLKCRCLCLAGDSHFHWVVGFTSFVCSPPTGEALTQSSLLEADGENITTAVEPMNLHHAMLRSAGRASSQSGPEVTFYLVELSGHSLRWPLSPPIRIYFTVWFIEPTRQVAAFRRFVLQRFPSSGNTVDCSVAAYKIEHFFSPLWRGNTFLPECFTIVTQLSSLFIPDKSLTVSSLAICLHTAEVWFSKMLDSYFR